MSWAAVQFAISVVSILTGSLYNITEFYQVILEFYVKMLVFKTNYFSFPISGNKDK